MKKVSLKAFKKKFVLAIMTVMLLFQFLMPVKSQAFELFDDISGEEIGNAIAVGIAQFFGAIGDVVMGGFNKFFLGTQGFGSAMITSDSLGKGSWFDPIDDEGNTVTPNSDEASGVTGFKVGSDSTGEKTVVYVEDSSIDSEAILAGSSTWEVPNILYCPENIFGNNIAMLDVNFLNPNQYQSVLVADDRGTSDAEAKTESVASSLKSTISGWYRSFRNIAVVALLSILVYLGIRILISSSAEDKAKYKETIKDWAIALVLVFAMHFIMSATIMIVNLINNLFVDFNNSVYVYYNGQMFRSNFTGVMRFLSRSVEWENALVFTGVYAMLILYTISFTIQYLKRVLYIAFYTMIAPLVAITYPLDKLGDGKSQAFNKWLKEYMMTMALQPIHLIIYSMIVSSALTLAIENPIYALVALGFLIPAEQFIKSLFGVESKADGGMGSFAAGAAGMAALSKLASVIKGGNSGNAKKDADDEEETSNVRESVNSELGSFSNNAPIGPGGGDDDSEGPNRPRLGSGNAEDNGSLDNESEAGINLGGYGDDNGVGGYGQYDSSGHLIEAGNNFDGEGDAGLPYGGSEDNADSVDTSSGLSQADILSQQNEAGFNAATAAAAAFESDNTRSALGQLFYDKTGFAPFRNMRKKKAIKKAVSASNKKYKRMLRDKKWDDFKADRNNDHPIRSAIAKDFSSAKKKARVNLALGKKYRGKFIKKAGKPIGKLLKFAARNGMRIAGAATVGTLGAVAGLASGKGISGAMQGFTTGAVAGATVGDKAYKAPGAIASGVKGVEAYGRGIRDLYTEKEIERLSATQGDAAAQKYAREHLTRAQTRKYDKILNDYQIKTGERIRGKSKEELYKDLYDYESHGVKDESKMLRGLQLEHASKYSDLRNSEPNATHDNVVDIMQMTNTFDDSYIDDGKKHDALQHRLSSRGLNNDQKEMFNKFFRAAHGRDFSTDPLAGADNGSGPISVDNGSGPATRQTQTSEPRTRTTNRRRDEVVDPFAKYSEDASPRPSQQPRENTNMPKEAPKAKTSRRRMNLKDLSATNDNNPTE